MMRATNHPARGLSLRDYVQMIWQRKWVVIAVTLIAAGLAIATRPRPTAPVYQATATVRVQTFEFTSSGDTSVVPGSSVPPAEVEAARSVQVAAETADELGLDDGGAGILSRLNVTAQTNTDLLELSLVGTGVGTVEQLETYADRYVDFRNEQDEERVERALDEVDSTIATIQGRLSAISSQLAEEDQEGEPSPETQTRYQAVSTLYTTYVDLRERIRLDAALAGARVELVGSPVTQRLGALPTRTLRVIAGPLAGFLLGCALAIGLGVLRPRVTGRERTEERLGVPVLATIPHLKHRRVGQDPLVIQRLSGWGAEGIRMLRTELDLVEERLNQLRVVCIVSPQPRDGKSTVAANLAASYSSVGRNTALIHADLRATRVGRRRWRKKVPRPIDHTMTGLPVTRNPAGFGEVHLGEARNRVGDEPSKAGLVSAIEDLTAGYDLVVVDTPPLLAFADAMLLATESDAVVLVARHGKTSEDAAAETLEILTRHDTPVAGVVLNGVRVGRVERYRYRRYYGLWNDADATGGDEAVPSPPTAAIAKRPPPAPDRGNEPQVPEESPAEDLERHAYGG